MRVAQVVPCFVSGGAEKIALDFHRFLLETGYDSHLVALGGPLLDQPGCVSLNAPHPRHPVCLLRLRRWLVQQQKQGRPIDVLHAHLFPDQLWSPLAARGLTPRPALIATKHDLPNRLEGLPLGWLLDRYLYGQFTETICVSESIKTSLAAWQPALSARLRTILNGIDHDRVVPRRPRPGDQTVRLFFTGRLAPQKDPDGLVRAMATLTDLPCRLSIAGDGPLRDRLSTQISDLGLSDRVELLGHRSDIPDLLAGADIFVLPSRHEGFGLAVVEAMAAGLPVVATDIPPFREILASGAQPPCAILVPPNDPAALAAALRRLIDSPEEATAMGRAAKARAALYDQRACFQSILAEYSRLSADRR